MVVPAAMALATLEVSEETLWVIADNDSIQSHQLVRLVELIVPTMAVHAAKDSI